MISFEFLLRNIPNDYTYKRNYLDNNAKEIEVLYLGNSHILYGINPVFSKYKSFNCAHGSQSLNYDFAILNKYKKQWKKLKLIVVPVTLVTAGVSKVMMAPENALLTVHPLLLVTTQ